jgi:hypothetical protein
MGTITRGYSYTSGNTITAAENEANETTLYNEFNGNIDNANIKASAGIAESKLSFNTASGHDHDGSNSKAIPKGFVFTVTGTATIGTSVAPALPAISSMTFNKAYVYCKTPPTGANLIVDINKNGTSIWGTNTANRVTLTAGSAIPCTQTSFDTTTCVENDIITVDIDQVGSTEPGQDLTVILR